jgi:hypothetical protein
MQGQQREAATVDLDMELIDGSVAAENLGNHVGVACHEAFDGRAHAVFREAAHFEQARFQVVELLLEMPNDPFRHYPNLPVT